MTRILAAMLVVGLVIAPGAALAGDEDVRREGSCSAQSNWKLKLSPEDGGIEVEYEVDQSVNDQKWRVRMLHDGERFFAGTRTTKGPSGSFEVRRIVNDLSGADLIKARARNLQSDEVCRGKATI